MNNFKTLPFEEHIEPLLHMVDLVPQHAVAEKIHDMVSQPSVRAHLRTRHLLRVIDQYGTSPEAAKKAIETARTLQHHQKLGVFVLWGSDRKEVLGMATVDPAAALRSQRFALPPFLARGPLSEKVVVGGPEVRAWVLPGTGLPGSELLTTAYKALGDPKGLASAMYARYVELQKLPLGSDVQAFTVEPSASPDRIRAALESAGYVPNGDDYEGYYDDGESRTAPTPWAGLYQVAS